MRCSTDSIPRREAGRLRLVVRPTGPWLEMSVSDDGQGVPSTEVEQLFFAERPRVHALALLRRRLQGLFGRSFQLEVRSEIGEGTTVTMRIPLRKRVRSWLRIAGSYHLGSPRTGVSLRICSHVDPDPSCYYRRRALGRRVPGGTAGRYLPGRGRRFGHRERGRPASLRRVAAGRRLSRHQSAG